MRPILCSFILLLSVNGFGQDTGFSIKGKIVDTKNAPVEFANIFLLRNDSSFVKGVSSDSDGEFTISDVSPDDYLLKITCLGHLDTYISLSAITQNRDLGTLAVSDNAHVLQEVVVSADRIIEKSSKQILFPDDMQIKTSTQGFDLLSKMQLPDIVINGANRTLSALDGGGVQIRINGLKVNVNELSAIRPEDILRIDFYNMPGARYGNENVSAVIDVILKEKRTGGYVMTDLMNATFTGFGNDQWVAKINHKDSEFGFSYALNYRDYKERWYDSDDAFNFPNNPFERKIRGVKMPFGYQFHDLNFSYNLASKDKLFVHLVLKNEILSNHHSNLENLIYYSNRQETIRSQSQEKTKSQTPVVDAYFKYKLSDKQSVAFNLVGTYISTDYSRSYSESDNATSLLSLNNTTDGKKYSLIAELIYEKIITDKLNLNVGAKHLQGDTKNTYTGSSNAVTEMNNTNSYIYTEVNGTYRNLGYSAGIGVTRIWFKEQNHDYTYYSLRPSVQLTYKFHPHFSSRYAFIRSTVMPTLSELSDVRQAIDGFLYTEGNPTLRPYNVMSNTLTFSYNRNRIGVNFTLRYRYYDKPIMEAIYREADKLVNVSENQPKFQLSGGFLNLQIEAIKNRWRLNLTGGVNHYQSNGKNYLHRYTNYWGSATSNFMYGNFDLNLVFYSRRNSLWGEYVNLGDDYQSIDVGYKYKDVKFGIGMLYPFKSDWSGGSENLSSLMREKSMTHIADNGRMLYLRFSWNFSYGKKSKSFTKDLNNEDSDNGIKSLGK
jgi:hypothetical protein